MTLVERFVRPYTHFSTLKNLKLSIFYSSEASKEWAQLLKIRMNRELSLIELF